MSLLFYNRVSSSTLSVQAAADLFFINLKIFSMVYNKNEKNWFRKEKLVQNLLLFLNLYILLLFPTSCWFLSLYFRFYCTAFCDMYVNHIIHPPPLTLCPSAHVFNYIPLSLVNRGHFLSRFAASPLSFPLVEVFQYSLSRRKAFDSVYAMAFQLFAAPLLKSTNNNNNNNNDYHEDLYYKGKKGFWLDVHCWHFVKKYFINILLRIFYRTIYAKGGEQFLW